MAFMFNFYKNDLNLRKIICFCHLLIRISGEQCFVFFFYFVVPDYWLSIYLEDLLYVLYA